MPKVKRKVKVKVKITSFEMGELFGDMDETQQAEFFDGVYSSVKNWPGQPEIQWRGVARALSDEGRQVLKEMADYA